MVGLIIVFFFFSSVRKLCVWVLLSLRLVVLLFIRLKCSSVCVLLVLLMRKFSVIWLMWWILLKFVFIVWCVVMKVGIWLLVCRFRLCVWVIIGFIYFGWMEL